jgi:hypothetical protein
MEDAMNAPDEALVEDREERRELGAALYEIEAQLQETDKVLKDTEGACGR